MRIRSDETYWLLKNGLMTVYPPDTYYVLGFGGNGITFSVMGLQIISDALAKRPNRFMEYFRFDR